MAGEISTNGLTIKYCVEASVGVRPTTGFKEKATNGILKISEYVTGISGLNADYDLYEVTPLSETSRKTYVKGLQNNDGRISFSANINPTSRADWDKIVDEFAALTGGKGMWFEFTLKGDTESFFVRAEPCEMGFPDVESASACQGAINLIENDNDGWQTKTT